jgi:hypothetical protein
MESRQCRIDSALGYARECPKELCPFWSENACIVTGLRADLPSSPGLAQLLFGVRQRLGGRPPSGIDHTLIPPGLR